MTGINDNHNQDSVAETPATRSGGISATLWRGFKAFSRTVIYLPLGALIILAILLGTPLGSRLAVSLADIFVPDLDITYVSGTLNKRLEVTRAHWAMDGISVEADDLILDWRPMCLLSKQLCVNELAAGKVLVSIDTEMLGDNNDDMALTDEEPIDNQFDDEQLDEQQEIRLPFGIDLKRADLANVKVRVNDMQFNASRLQTQAQWQQSGIRANYLYSSDLLVSIPLSDTGEELETKQSGDPTAHADANDWPMAHLPAVFMPIPVFVTDAVLERSHLRLGERDDFFESIILDGSYHSFLVNLNQLLVEHSYGKVNLKGGISLKDDYPMEISATVDAHSVAELPGLKRQQLSLHLSRGFKNLAVTATGSGHVDFNLLGEIALADSNLPYSLNFEGKKLGWPLDKPSYAADGITLVTQGGLDHQDVTLTANIKTPFHPTLAVDTQFSHTGTQLDVAYLRLLGEPGEAELSGSAQYDDGISWDADIKAQNLQLQQVKFNLETPLPDSIISGQVHTRGHVSNERWEVGISDSDLDGEIQGYPFKLIGDLNVDDKLHLSAENLKLSALQSILQVSGTADNSWAVDAKLQVPDLNLWHAESYGSIDASINVSGESEHPQVAVSAHVSDIEFQQHKIEQALVKGFYQPKDEHEFALSVKAKDLNVAAVKLDSVTLGFKGNENKQKFGLRTYGELQLNTKIYSTYDTESTQLEAEVRNLSLNFLLGKWALEAPIDLSWNNDKQTGIVNPFCWLNENGRLCLDDATELAANGETSLLFDGDIGGVLKPLLPENLNWQAPAKLFSNIKWQEGSKPEGFLELNLAPGQISLNNNNRMIDVGYKLLNFKASLDQDKLISQLKFDSHDIASWEGQLEISVAPDRTLSGYTKLEQINLDALSELMPQLETLTGKISSELEISGTLAKPDVSGKVRLEQGQLLAAANPTLLEDIELDLTLSGQSATLDGQWKMGSGKAQIGGLFNWQGDNFNGDIQFGGEKLAIIQPPLAIITASPELSIKFDTHRADIQGLINIDSGNIKVSQLPEGGVAVSDDVVFQDSLSSGEVEQSPYAITTNIKIKVADRLRIDGMGLRGKLTGTLDLRQEAFRPPLLYGDIRVVDGSYKFMGQTLKINAGEVQFIGPAEVPSLNIEAVREIKDEDVVAGVRITGTPLKPIVTLFSSPVKEQAEILSYIIKGTGFHSNDGDQNSSLMMGAALTLSNQLGGGAVNLIGESATGLIEKVGFSNVQLDANDDGRVAISGYIGENLMVKYGVGVFNPGYEMTVRYYLLSQLYLETVSGSVEQSLDIYYNFNID
ncbi:translocation/assembly module TamB domain-containing protein [uncultured Shewanella sp.]|uniref:autotransporter assembly complex protein TamB n=1 Tax=uncultured Shewanella sp. TaxID=173975 RepID=UPI00260D8D4C|nr:translocation/assembly module TamB domain-containing protein [uncultured Shewanella sp.]